MIVLLDKRKKSVSVFFKAQQVVDAIEVKVKVEERHAVHTASPCQREAVIAIQHKDVLITLKTGDKGVLGEKRKS